MLSFGCFYFSFSSPTVTVEPVRGELSAPLHSEGQQLQESHVFCPNQL